MLYKYQMPKNAWMDKVKQNNGTIPYAAYGLNH